MLNLEQIIDKVSKLQFNLLEKLSSNRIDQQSFTAFNRELEEIKILLRAGEKHGKQK